jgi:hypothetical protein
MLPAVTHVCVLLGGASVCPEAKYREKKSGGIDGGVVEVRWLRFGLLVEGGLREVVVEGWKEKCVEHTRRIQTRRTREHY